MSTTAVITPKIHTYTYIHNIANTGIHELAVRPLHL